MISAILRSTFGACAVAAIWAVSACAGKVAEPSGPPRTISIELAYGERVSVPGESMIVSIVDIDDSRCAVDMACVWAGDARVTLQVSKAGSATEQLTIANRAFPPGSKRPIVAQYGHYQFRLVSLEPDPPRPPMTLNSYRAVVEVSTAIH